jgi:acetate kinase
MWQNPMMPALTINAGSSSIRFALFGQAARPKRLLSGKIDRIGTARPVFTVSETAHGSPTRIELGSADRPLDALLDWLAAHAAQVEVIGHRVVHGMQRAHPEKVTPGLLRDLKRMVSQDPEHLPREIALIEECSARFPQLPQVACFDTAFHRTMPTVATLLAIPRRYRAKGVQRYGFHGLSYTYLMQELGRQGDPAAARGRVILAHLGSGASLAAVRDGSSIDTSMGFTPAAGLPMSTRSGDLDPGVMTYLAESEALDGTALERMVNHESGLLGVSESSPDIRDLLAREAEDARAAEALALFCYQAKKWIGAFAAALGGLDTLVFAGGIGENSAPIRARICAGLEFLGIELSPARNAAGESKISQDSSRVAVRVIPTDEESVIAGLTFECLRPTRGSDP